MSGRDEWRPSEHAPIYRTSTGRLVSVHERVAAAEARITADKKRGVETPAWIVSIANRESE